MAPRSDNLGVKYAKKMRHFGCGIAMFQPISAGDMRPPCVGYLEKDGTWNHIANITWQEPDGRIQGGDIVEGLDVSSGHAFKPLDRPPKKMEQLGIEWRPRTSQGVRQLTVDASGTTPNNIPIGAGAHIKYKSNHSFGAVLITQNPITLTSYNDEILFQSWLTANKSLLSLTYGHQLRRHGLIIVTRTYTAPCCSINAWIDRDKEANMSVKAKANMMGELGEALDLTDKLTDQDWSHYSGKEKGDTVVVFFDGITVPPWDWYLENLRTSISRLDASDDRSPSRSSDTQRLDRPHNAMCAYSSSATDDSMDESSLLSEDLWGSDTPLQILSPLSSRSPSRGRQVRFEEAERPRRVSTSTRQSKNLDCDEKPSIPVQRPKAAPTPNHKPSMMSSATSSPTASTRAPSLEIHSPESSTPPTRHRSELRRKTGSPSLRDLQ